MDWSDPLIALGVLSGVLLIAVIGLTIRIRRLSARLERAEFDRKSLAATYGRITEQWFPLLDEYPYDPQEFRFLGSPVDGVQFNEDGIIFVEFKANRSRLSDRQKRIKRLIEEGNVRWEEFHFAERVR